MSGTEPATKREAFLLAIDEGLPFDGFAGWMPSTLFEVGEIIIASGPRPAFASSFSERMIAEARSRYRAGCFANPFARERVQRADLAGYRRMMSERPGRDDAAPAAPA